MAAATLGEVVSVRAVTVIGNRYGCCSRDGGMFRSSSIVIPLPHLKVRCPTRKSASVNAIKRRVEDGNTSDIGSLVLKPS